MAGTNEIFEALQCGRPWVGAIANQPALLCGIGLADPFLRSNISGPETTRYSSGAFAFTELTDALSTPNADLFIATNTQIQLFVNGLTDLGAIEGLWWNLTTGDTNLGQGGNPIDRQLGFMCCGATVETPDPYQRLATANTGFGLAPTNPRFYPFFLTNGSGTSAVGQGYAAMLKSAVLNNVNMQVQFGNLGITNRLGLLAQYPAWGGPQGNNGQTNSPLMYQPFQAAMLIGPQNEMTKLQMTLSFGQAVRIGNNANLGAIGAATSGVPPIPLLDTNVYQPVRVSMVGYIVCVPQDILCGVPVAFPQQAPSAPAPITYSAQPQPIASKGPSGWIR